MPYRKIKTGDLVLLVRRKPSSVMTQMGDCGLVIKAHSAMFGDSESVCVVEWCKDMGRTMELSSHLKKVNV